jgi:hypothetical protein
MFGLIFVLVLVFIGGYWLCQTKPEKKINFSVEYQYISQLNTVAKECSLLIIRKTRNIPEIRDSFHNILMDDVWTDIDNNAPDLHYILKHLCDNNDLTDYGMEYTKIIGDFLTSWSEFLESQNGLCLAMTIWLDTKFGIDHITELSLDNRYLWDALNNKLNALEIFIIEKYNSDTELLLSIGEIRDFAGLPSAS